MLARRLLMFASGIPTAEKPTAKKYFLMSHATRSSSSSNLSDSPEYPDAWEKYKNYLASTSILLPIPPLLYRPLPSWLKKTVLLDFPMYSFDEAKDGKEALKETR
jgi:hypothetical protein